MYEYLVVMVVFVSVEFALMRSDKQRQVVSPENSFGYVWTEVAAAATESVWPTAVLRRWITPQHVEHLRTHADHHPCTLTTVSVRKSSLSLSLSSQILTSNPAVFYCLTSRSTSASVAAWRH